MSEIVKETPEEIKIFAVDADIIAYRCAAVNEQEDEEGTRDTIDEFLHTLARDTGIDKMRLFLSPPTNFRYRVAKTRPYKGARKNNPRPKYIEQAKQYMKVAYKAFIMEDYEADDCIASYMTSYNGVAHAGMDKDIKQIQGWHYDFVKKHWEFTSKEDSILRLYRQVCMGDSTDSIPGIPGIGEKKAANAITDPDSAEDICRLMYYKNIVGMSKKEIDEYYKEQYTLIALVDNLVIDFNNVTIVPPAVFEDKSEEGDFVGFDEDNKECNEPSKPKTSIFSNSKSNMDKETYNGMGI